MLLTYDELLELVERGVILGARRERVNAASIDVTLGRWIWVEDSRGGRVDLAARQAVRGQYNGDREAQPSRGMR